MPVWSCVRSLTHACGAVRRTVMELVARRSFESFGGRTCHARMLHLRSGETPGAEPIARTPGRAERGRSHSDHRGSAAGHAGRKAQRSPRAYLGAGIFRRERVRRRAVSRLGRGHLSIESRPFSPAMFRRSPDRSRPSPRRYRRQLVTGSSAQLCQSLPVGLPARASRHARRAARLRRLA